MEKKGGKIALLLVILLITLVPSSLFLIHKISAEATVVNGVAQVSDYKGKLVALRGTCDLIWNELGAPSGESVPAQTLTASIPGVWNGLTYQGQPLGGFGYGTYRMTLKGLTPGEKYGLYIPLLSVSFRVSIDGIPLAQNGAVSTSAEGFVPAFLPQTASFTPSATDAVLTVETSNYIYARNGMWHPIYLGSEEQIVTLNRMIQYRDLFFIGAFLTLAVYYASTFLLRKEKQSLLFVLLCIGASMRMMVNGDRMIVRLFQSFPFAWIVRCDYLAILLFYPIMLYLMTRRFPNEFSKPFAYIIFGVGATGSLLVLLLPVPVFTQYVIVAEAMLFVNLLYTLSMLARAVLHGRKSATPMFISVMLLLCLTLHDTLYQMGKIDNALGEIASFGFFVFLLLESFAISRDYAESFHSVQQLSRQLLESEALKDRIRQTELAFLRSQIKPHFLYNTLSVIDEYCVVDPPKASRLINSLAQYLRQSFVFDNLEDCVKIETELSHVRSYVEIEQARFVDLKVEYELDYVESFLLPQLSIQPLVENAIRHGVRKKAGAEQVLVSIQQEDNEIVVTISDKGAGIPAERLATLLTVPSASVGLVNIHNRLMHKYGRGLTIVSTEGEGTTVSFRIPKG